MAYNYASKNYLAAVTVARSPVVVAAVAIRTGITMHGPYMVDNYTYGRLGAAFSGGKYDLGNYNNVNEYMISNTKGSGSAQFVNSDIIPDRAVSSPVEQPVISVRAGDSTVGNLANSDLCGSPYHGNYLVVWEEEIYVGDPTGANILAQMVAPNSYIFLPMIVK